MKTLLIATDLSDKARQAAAYGYRLAQQLKARVLLCHVMNVPAEIPQTGMVAWPADVYEDMLQDSDNELARLKCRLIAEGEAGLYQPDITCVHEAGWVTDVVNAEADAHQADMILIGTHGDDRFTTLMIGNHSRKMIEAAVRPLLLIPAGVRMEPVKKIAFACDFTEPEKDAGRTASVVAFAKALDAELILTHVDQRSDAPGYMLTGKHLLEELISKFDYPKICFKVVSSKQVENGLDWLVRDEAIDLLAMVHREHGFFEQLLKGSHTQKTASQLPVPLLVLKP